MLGCRVSRSGLVLDTTPIPLCAPNAGNLAALDYSAGVYTVAWPSSSEIAGCRVSPAGAKLDSFSIAATPDGLEIPLALTSTQGGNPLVAYQGCTGLVGSRRYDVDRIWGIVLPFGGVQESRPPASCSAQLSAGPNPFHDHVSFLLASASPGGRGPSIAIYDAAGRLVHRLPIATVSPQRQPIVLIWNGRNGANQPVPPGLYFSRLEPGCGQPPLKIVRTN